MTASLPSSVGTAARRVVFTRPGVPLQVREFDVARPEAGGLLVAVTHAGICGSDAHRLDGDQAVQNMPVAFGHEGVGTVAELGDGVAVDWAGRALRVGDPVYWNPTARCGRCHLCRAAPAGSIASPAGFGCANLRWPPSADRPSPAAFQDVATLSAAVPVYRIPDGVPPEAVIAFGCAMPTALGGFQRLGPITPGHVVVVQGSGPVGLASTMLAALSPARHVIVIGAPDNRLVAARRLGATVTIPLESTTSDERRSQIADLTDGAGASVVIEAAGQLPAFDEGLSLLAPEGRYLVLGLFSGSGTVKLDPYRLNNFSLSIIGSLGTPADSRLRTLELAARHHERLGLVDLITHRFPLSETESAIASMRDGVAIKAVVEPGSQTP